MKIKIFFDTDSGEQSTEILTNLRDIEEDVERALKAFGCTMEDYTGMEELWT